MWLHSRNYHPELPGRDGNAISALNAGVKSARVVFCCAWLDRRHTCGQVPCPPLSLTEAFFVISNLPTKSEGQTCIAETHCTYKSTIANGKVHTYRVRSLQLFFLTAFIELASADKHMLMGKRGAHGVYGPELTSHALGKYQRYGECCKGPYRSLASISFVELSASSPHEI